MPTGAVPPFIMRYDTGSVPVAQLVFSSSTRSPGEMQDIALNRVRPIFATLPGVSAPPPFGGNQRTIVVRVDPEKMRQFTDEMKEELRRRLAEAPPNVTVSFQAADIIGQVMSFGSPTPIEVAVQGPDRSVGAGRHRRPSGRYPCNLN